LSITAFLLTLVAEVALKSQSYRASKLTHKILKLQSKLFNESDLDRNVTTRRCCVQASVTWQRVENNVTITLTKSTSPKVHYNRNPPPN